MRLFETRAQSVPQVEQLVAEQEAKVLVNVLLDHPLGPPDQKLLQRVVGPFDQRWRLHRQLQALGQLSATAQAHCGGKESFSEKLTIAVNFCTYWVHIL